MSEDLATMGMLLDASIAALDGNNFKLATIKLNALLDLSENAVSLAGVNFFLQGLTGAICVCMVHRDPDRAEHFLTKLQDRLERHADLNLASGFHNTLTRARRDIDALRGGRSRTNAVSLFFELYGVWLPVGQEVSGEAQTGGLILRAVAEQGGDQMQFRLTEMAMQIVVCIVEDKFRSRNWGSLIGWLDEVEPYLTRCSTERCLWLIQGWSEAYQTVALHGEAEHTFSDVLDRTETLVADSPAPPYWDAADWERTRGKVRQKIRLFADAGYATVLGTRRDAQQAAQRVMQSEFAAGLSAENRLVFETQASGKRLATTYAPPVWNLGYSRRQLVQALELLKSDHWEAACNILAPLAASEPERDGDFAAGVPFALAVCIAAAFPRQPGAVSAEIALLKEAVRQIERQRLEVSDQARGTLNIMESRILRKFYLSLRDSLLVQGRIGEAIRVETLLAERDHRLPISPDQTLLEQAAERLPCFPAEIDFWTRAKATAGGTVSGRDWLTQLLREPPRLNFGEGGVPPSLPHVTVRKGEVHIALTLSGDRLAAVLRDDRGREKLIWINVGPQEFNRLVLKLQMAIRQHSPSVADDAEALGTMLISPLEDFLSRAAPLRLLIEPAGPVSHVPFPALRVNGAYLAERFEIVLQDGRPEQPDTGAKADGIVSIGASGRESGNALRWIEKDLELVASFAASAGLRVDSFGQGRARKTSILERLARPCRILHVSSHFQAQLLDMAASAFILDHGERLTVDELSQCALANCDLALLLGCETAARPPAAPGSPMVGVDSALLRLGVRSVVSSQWPVDDLASHLFLKTFLQVLAVPGTTKATAVRTAQLALMKSEHLYLRHPNHWAAFTLAGCC